MNSFLYSLKETAKSFFSLPADTPDHAPYVSDPIDIKRIMTLVVIALFPCMFFAILNSGMLGYLYESINIDLFEEYVVASNSKSIFNLISFQCAHFFPFFFKGLKLFIPQLLIIYMTGGIVEIYFASLHRKTVSEGFFVTGILFALVIPPTLPYWMTIFGVIFGLVLGKELFGGTGMNIFNPALVCRCIIYFSFPSYMTGNIWVGDNTFKTLKNSAIISKEIQAKGYDAITTATPLNIAEQAGSLTKLQIDGSALLFTKDVDQKAQLSAKLKKYNSKLQIDNLTNTELIGFLQNGLEISENQMTACVNYAKLVYNQGSYSNANLIYGNMGGSFGEVSKLATLLGLIFLLLMRLVSIPIILSSIFSALFFAKCLSFFANPETASAYLFLPAYKHLLIGGFFFAIVFMATEPVTAPASKAAQIAYGIMIGVLTITIRVINPAFPEGVMLAILFANSFSPLLDRIFLSLRKRAFTGKVTASGEILL